MLGWALIPGEVTRWAVVGSNPMAWSRFAEPFLTLPLQLLTLGLECKVRPNLGLGSKGGGVCGGVSGYGDQATGADIVGANELGKAIKDSECQKYSLRVGRVMVVKACGGVSCPALHFGTLSAEWELYFQNYVVTSSITSELGNSIVSGEIWHCLRRVTSPLLIVISSSVPGNSHLVPRDGTNSRSTRIDDEC